MKPGPPAVEAQSPNYWTIREYLRIHFFIDFPSGSDGRVYLQYRKLRFNPWVRKIPWRREWQPTPVFLLENSMDRESDNTEWLSLLFLFKWYLMTRTKKASTDVSKYRRSSKFCTVYNKYLLNKCNGHWILVRNTVHDMFIYFFLCFLFFF